LKEDEIIEGLVPEPANVPEVKVFVGLLGKSTGAGRWRLYNTGLLNDYIEFAEEDLLYHLRLAPRHGTVIWLKRSANVQQTRIANADVPDFFRGDVMSALASSMGVQDLMGPGGLAGGHFAKPWEPTKPAWACVTATITITITLTPTITWTTTVTA
jgi:hypothetical protein